MSWQDTPCEIFKGHITSHGYGWDQGGRNGLGEGAHRVAYIKQYGYIPRGLHLDHLCRNRACVNPLHLEPVTPRENCLRGMSPLAINARKTHCIRGHELSGENLYLSKVGRSCRACAKLRYLEKKLLKKES